MLPLRGNVVSLNTTPGNDPRGVTAAGQAAIGARCDLRMRAGAQINPKDRRLRGRQSEETTRKGV